MSKSAGLPFCIAGAIGIKRTARGQLTGTGHTILVDRTSAIGLSIGTSGSRAGSQRATQAAREGLITTSRVEKIITAYIGVAEAHTLIARTLKIVRCARPRHAGALFTFKAILACTEGNLGRAWQEFTNALHALKAV